MAARLELIEFPLQKDPPTLALTIVVILESLDLDTHHLMRDQRLKPNQFLKVRSFSFLIFICNKQDHSTLFSLLPKHKKAI